MPLIALLRSFLKRRTLSAENAVEMPRVEGFTAIRNGQRVLVIASKLEAWIIENSDKM